MTQELSMGKTGSSKCPPLEELAAYCDGRLSPASRDRLESHLVVCPDCLDQVIEVQSWQELELLQPPFSALRRAQSLPVAGRRRWQPAWMTGAVAAGVLVAWLGFHLGRETADYEYQVQTTVADYLGSDGWFEEGWS